MRVKKRQNESALVFSAQRGDKEAMQLLLTRNWTWLKGLVYSIVGQADQIDDVLLGDHYPLLACQPPLSACFEKTLYFFVDPADWLDVSPLIYRASDGDTLFERDPTEAAEQGVKLSGAGAISFNAIVQLLK